MNIRQQTVLLISCSLVLCLGHASSAQGFKVYISTDMEGCSGITCSEQVAAEEGAEGKGSGIGHVIMDFLRLPAIALVGVLLYAEQFELSLALGTALMVAGNVINVSSQTRVQASSRAP